MDRYTEFVSETGGSWNVEGQAYFYGGVVFPPDLSEDDDELTYKLRYGCTFKKICVLSLAIAPDENRNMSTFTYCPK